MCSVCIRKSGSSNGCNHLHGCLVFKVLMKNSTMCDYKLSKDLNRWLSVSINLHEFKRTSIDPLSALT